MMMADSNTYPNINLQKMEFEIFNRRCWFDLKTGETLVGGVIDVKNNIIQIETRVPEKRTITFSSNLVYRYEVSQNGHFNRLQNQINPLNNHYGGYIQDNKRTKKLIIFGAGASADQIAGNKRPAPLTNDLFGDRDKLKLFPGAEKLRQKVLTFMKTGKSLEDFFEEKWQEVFETGDDELMSRLINTQYYLQFLFKEISKEGLHLDDTNYGLFAERLRQYLMVKKDENIAVVTFNYDTLFENALHHILDYQFSSPYDYVFENKKGDNYHKPIMLFKPHGSWNWIHRFNNAPLPIAPPYREAKLEFDIHAVAKDFYDKKFNYAQLKLAIAPELANTQIGIENIPIRYMGKFHIPSYDEKLDYEYYPNMLIPFKRKDEMLMPEFHETYFKSRLKHVEEIFIVGWKGTEHHFNTVLKYGIGGRKVKIIYVSPNSKTVEEELSKYLPEAEFVRIQASFSDFLIDFNDVNKWPYNPFRL